VSDFFYKPGDPGNGSQASLAWSQNFRFRQLPLCLLASAAPTPLKEGSHGTHH